jgi:TonB family protein
MTKIKHLAAAFFAAFVTMADAPADQVLPFYREWNVPDGVTIPEITEAGGHAVAVWFNSHPGCPDKKPVVEFTVTKDGKVGDEVKTLASSEIPTLDQAFIKDVRKLTFKPATKDGAPVASIFRYGLAVDRRNVCTGTRGGGAFTMP